MTRTSKASITRTRLRLGLLLALVGALAGAGLLAPTAASAAPGDGPGGLTLTPSQGSTGDQPIADFATATACPADHRGLANVELLASDGTDLGPLSTNFVPTDTPVSGTLNITPLSTPVTSSGDYELALWCYDPDFNGFVVPDNVWIHVDVTAGTWQLRTGGSSAVATTTALGASPTTAAPGADVVLTATVTAQDTAGADAVGSVEFFNGSASLGSAAVSRGTASKTVNNLPVGDNPITAKFTPTDPTAFGASTSTPVTVTVSAAGGLDETINVNIPSTGGGTFTFTVSADPVTMSDATLSGADLTSSGTLSPVTVIDTRTGKPGWSVSGQATNFTSGGTNTIDGNALGWVPSFVSGGAGATLGTSIPAGTNPGLKQGARLASAAAGQGTGTTELRAGLSLKAPADTAPGRYTAALTITAVEAAN